MSTKQLASKLIPRRNKRTQGSSPNTLLNSLISLYHFTPTFAPLSPASLDPYVVSKFVPEEDFAHQVHPQPLRSVIAARQLLDVEAISFSNPSKKTSIHEMALEQPLAYPASSLDLMSAGTSSATLDSSILLAYKEGAEPPLKRRMREMMDTLHGTSSGSLAGLDTIRDPSLVKEGLERRSAVREGRKIDAERARREELEGDGFGAAFEEIEPRIEERM